MQTGHENNGRRLGGEIKFGRGAADELNQFPVHHTDQRLPGRQTGKHFLAERLFAHFRDEIAHDWKRHIGLEQGDADFPQHFLGVGFGETGFAAHRLHDTGKTLGEIVEHGLRYTAIR